MISNAERDRIAGLAREALRRGSAAKDAKRAARRAKRPAGYGEALAWLLREDDTSFLDDGPDAALSVSASMVADLYRKDDERVRADLAKLREKGKTQ